MPQSPHKIPHISLLTIIDEHFDKIKSLISNVKITDSDCWEYQNAFDGGGKFHSYGRINISHYGRKIRLRAHRVSYAFFNGTDPKEYFVCHKCDNPKCINPDHLFLGTMSDNMRDMVNKGRHASQSGERNHAAKLQENDIRKIIARIQAGETNKQIAAQLPVTHSLVSLIRRGKAWAQVARAVGYVPGEKYETCRRAA